MEDDPTYAPVIMILFSFLLILTCVNMFIAILSEYFTLVMDETRKAYVDSALLEMMGTDWTVSSPSHLLKAGWNNIWCDWGLESHVYEGCLHPSNLPRDVVRFANNDENLRRFLNIEQVNCVSNDLFVEEEEQKEQKMPYMKV